jgi:hypothetical protein
MIVLFERTEVFEMNSYTSFVEELVISRIGTVIYKARAEV